MKELLKQSLDFLKMVAAITTSIGTVVVALAFLMAPKVDEYIDLRIDHALERLTLEKITKIIAPVLKTELDKYPALYDKPDLLDFKGNGIVIEDKIYYPGDTVRIAFLLRRNGNCDANIRVRFLYEKGYIDPELNSVIPAKKSLPNSDFSIFIVALKLPLSIYDGRWVYSAIVETIDCEERFESITYVPLSTPFEVKIEEEDGD